MSLLAVDSTTYSTVVVCRACGARFAATDRATALTLARPHTATHDPIAAHHVGIRVARITARQETRRG